MTGPVSPREPGGEEIAGAQASTAKLASRSLSLDDFVVLNDEIRAFVRAGIPLNVGFQGTASRSDGLLRDVAARIADRTAQGQSLTEAIEAEGSAVPAEYRALLTAGLRTGQLPQVLTSISALGESVARLKRQLRLALIYPAIVFALAYGLFVGLMLFVVPAFKRMRIVVRADESAFFRGLSFAADTVLIWGIGIPVVLLLLLVLRGIWLWISGHRTISIEGLGLLPGAGDISLARFANVLSVLVEYNVPLREALRLSGEVSGSARLQAAAAKLGDDVERGNSLRESLVRIHALPGFLKWLMTFGTYRGTLAESLRQAAGVYEQRALARLDRFRRIVPPLIVLIFGGAIVTAYALSVFLPMTELLHVMEDVPR